MNSRNQIISITNMAELQSLARGKWSQDDPTIKLCLNFRSIDFHNKDIALKQLILDAIKNAPAYTTINLQNNKIDNSDCEEIAKALVDIKHPLNLNLNHNNIDDEGAEHFICLMPFLPAGFYLNLSSNQIKVMSFSNIQSQIFNPIHLDLNDNIISSVGMRLIAQAIPHFPPNSKINLSYNKIEKNDFNLLAQQIKFAADNFEINLSGMQITHHDIKFLSYELARGKPNNLRLILQNNNLNDSAAKYFADMLGSAPQGFYLDLSNNIITSTGAINFANNIQSVPINFHLILSNNEIDNLFSDNLIKKLKIHMTRGFNLRLEKNNIDKRHDSAISTILKNHALIWAMFNCCQLHLGRLEKDNFLNFVPNEIWDLIYYYSALLTGHPNEIKDAATRFIKKIKITDFSFFSSYSISNKAETDKDSQEKLSYGEELRYLSPHILLA